MKSTVAWGLAFGLVLLAFAGTLIVYDSLPAEIPIHWNIRGEVDGWGAKSWAAWLLPGLMAGLMGLMAVLPKVSRRYDIASFRTAYDLVVLLVVVLFGALQVLTVAQARDRHLEAGAYLAGGMYVFFALIGMLMGQIRRNGWVGIRLPWTLASDRVWDDTHRLAAWLWIGAGLTGVACALLGNLWVGLVLLAPAVVVPCAYAAVRYRALAARGGL